MKKFLIPCLCIILWASCKEKPKSAFEGEEIKTNVNKVGTIPDESIYQLKDTFTTQDNKKITLANLSGKPTVLGMIFTHCDYACPRLTADIKNIKETMNSGDKINYLLVSFDTQRDTPAQLKKYAENSDLDNNWTLLHGSEESVRTLSILLNVQFVKDAMGNFSHSNIISVLDKNGNLIFQQEGLEANPEGIITTLKNLTK